MTAATVDERAPLPGPAWPPSASPPSFPSTDRRPVALADDPCEASFSGAGPEYAGIYLHARYFDPKLGTFLSPDPIGVAGGMNQYGYVFGNPINETDRSGLLKDQCEGMGPDECYRFSSDPMMSAGMGGFLGAVSAPGGGLAGFSPTLAAAAAEWELHLIETGHGGPYAFTGADGTTSVTLDPAATHLQNGIARFYHTDTGIGIEAYTERPAGVQVAANGITDALCHYACSPNVPGVAKPMVWLVMDSPLARAEKIVLIGAGNAAAQIGVTPVELLILFPFRTFNPTLIGDPNLRDHTAWYVVQGEFNDVWREFVFPPTNHPN